MIFVSNIFYIWMYYFEIDIIFMKHNSCRWIASLQAIRRSWTPPPFEESKEALGMLREIGATWGETVPLAAGNRERDTKGGGMC